MAYADLPLEAIWTRFFASASLGVDYKALVHCVDQSACEQSIRNQTIFKVIQTVASSWCHNLVGPMEELLAVALRDDIGHPADKFVFVSSTTVPAKRFQAVYHRLIVADGEKSNFCVSSQAGWAWYYGVVALKHHQWAVLNRADTETLVSKRSSPYHSELLDQLAPYRLLGVTWLGPLVKSLFRRSRYHLPWAFGCLDEYLFMALLHGFYSRAEIASGAVHPNINGGPILTSGPRSYDLQGRCDTYASFRNDGGNFTALTRVFDLDDKTHVNKIDRNRLNKPLHPIQFTNLSSHSLAALATSPFLFARKIDAGTRFAGSMSLDDAFDAFVFSGRAE